MERQQILLPVRALILATLLVSSIAVAQDGEPQSPAAPAEALGTGFTYQGQLVENGSPVNDECDMNFRLYDEATGGAQVGSAITATVPITDGLFTITLDFGAGVFDGDRRWLGIGVDCEEDGTYADLGRQELTAAPYALYAMGAPWSRLAGVPTGFADGVDDDTTYTAGDGVVLDGTEFSAQGSPYANVIVVAKSGGDFTSIQAALDSISGTVSNRYLIWVAPGTYTETVTMEEYVDIAGAGELLTRITYTGSASQNTGTVVGADNAELRFLTVENTGGDTYAKAIYNDGSSPQLTHVTVSASGGGLNIGIANTTSSPTMVNVTANASGGTNNYGVFNSASSSPTMLDVTASASGGDLTIGIFNNSSSPTMTNVTASASGGTDNYGMYNASSSPTMTDVTASASGGTNNRGMYNSTSSLTMTGVTASASGGTESYGVYNDSSSPTMTGVIASASGGTSGSYGVYNHSSSPTIQSSTLSASEGTNNYGIYNHAVSGIYTVTVSNCQLTGGSNTVRNDSHFTTLVGASLLSGGAVTGGGTITCAGVYDENYVWSDSTCP